MTPDQEKKLDELKQDVSDIKRGMFGEPRMAVPGLIKDVEDLKAWRASIRIKLAFLIGIASAVGFALERAWEWVTRK